MSRLLLIVAALVLSVNAWAAELDKSSSLTISKDAGASNPTATCRISVGGVDRRHTYSGVMLFQTVDIGQSGATTVFDAVFQVDPVNRIWTDSVPGSYTVTAKLKRDVVTVRADVPLAIRGGVLFCGSRIDPGTQPPTVGTTLFENHIRMDSGDVPW